MVSSQRTARLVSGTPTRKKLACWTGSTGLVGYWRRRDVTNRKHIGSSGKTVWKTVTRPEGDGLGQTGRRWLNWMAHSPASSSLQARTGGNALGSRPSLVRVPLQLPGNRPASPHSHGATGLGSERGRPGQSGRSSRGSNAPPGRYGKHTAGRRATGEGVLGRGSTEELDLMATHTGP